MDVSGKGIHQDHSKRLWDFMISYLCMSMVVKYV